MLLSDKTRVSLRHLWHLPWFASSALAALVASAPLASAAAERLPASFTNTALILYDGPVTNSESLLLARHTANLMGHFGFKAEIEPMSGYTAGLADSFRALFVCGMNDGDTVPQRLLEDVARRNAPTVWFHLHLEALTALTNAEAKLGFNYIENDDETDLPIVNYRGFKLPRSDHTEIDRVNITQPARVQVLATAENEEDEESSPYVLRSGQFWYFAGPGYSFETESDESLVFADLLHDILGVNHRQERRALARIEDVSADSDPDELRRVADILAARHVPFQIALVPLFRDPTSHINLSLSDEPEVVAAVHYMVARGGSVVMHGVTHQFHGVSGDDYEFWDTLANRATPDGALSVLGPKLQRGLDECFRAGLYPLVFETPHYGASPEHYRSLATVFSHCYERRMLCEQDDTVEYCPYLTTDIFGETVIPENLGYVPEETPDSLPVIEAAHRLRAVRDPVASFYFHPFMPSKYLAQILYAIQRDGYRFVSIKEFAPSLVLGDFAVAAHPRTVTLTPRQPYLKTTLLDTQDRLTEQIQKVSVGKSITLSLDPPPGGLVAVQSLAQPPVVQPTPERHWWDRLASHFRGSKGLAASAGHAREALILGSSPAFESALGVYGIPCRRFEPTNPAPEDSFLVVPHNAALDETTQERIAAWIARGGRALLEGRTPLAERLGFRFAGERFTPSRLQDYLVPDVSIKWSGTIEVERFSPPPLSATLIAEDVTGLPVAVASRVGDGVVIYLGTDLDPETGLGYMRYPFLVLHLRQRFGVEPQVAADGVEYYFDPGFRERTAVEELVKAWHNEGVRAIYAAAWHFYPNWTFDYDRLIRLCHAEGIAVYAWLELPAVTPQMWQDHPEWREKTVTGRDGEIGWRKFMNFANPDCRAAALKFVDYLLDRHDWDGVNVAELCFDTADGLAQPDGYIPMNPDVRREFQLQAGFDPALLFATNSSYYWRTNADALAQWTRFRTGLTRDWLGEVLQHLSARRLDVIVTALDSFSVPRVVEKSGCDSRDVVALMDRFPFTLQVEDPEDMWGESPARYQQYGEVYRKLVRDPARLMFDINVVKDRDHGKTPTTLASGLEIALAARAAAVAGNGRVGIYSESTVQLEDRGLLPLVMGAGTSVTARSNATTVVAARPVRFHYPPQRETGRWWKFWLSGPANQQPLPIVDGQPWFFGTKGTLLLASGRHQFQGQQAVPPSPKQILVRDFTAPFSVPTPTPFGFAFDYASPRRAWMRLSRQPSAVLSDNQPLANCVLRSGRDWLVALPAGRHHAEVRAATTLAVAVEQTGERALASIVWLGSRAVLFLALLYSLTRLRRLCLRLKGRQPAAANPPA